MRRALTANAHCNHFALLLFGNTEYAGEEICHP